MGLLHQRAGRMEEALQQYQDALEVDPTSAQALLDAGIALFEMEHYEEAGETLESAVTQAPDLAYAHLMLGVLYMDYLSDTERAATHLEAYTDLGGTDARVPGWMATLRRE